MNALEAKRKGYRVLAGPFTAADAEDAKLLCAVRQFITATGGRVASVEAASSPGDYYLFRPAAEMETIKETERRLKLAKLRG